MTAEERRILVNVLTWHWPNASNGCSCGWAKLGASYPEHIVDMYETALVEG